MSDRPDLGGPLAFFGYGLLALGLGAFLFLISPVRVDRLGGSSARQELEAEGVIEPQKEVQRGPRELIRGLENGGGAEGSESSAQGGAEGESASGGSDSTEAGSSAESSGVEGGGSEAGSADDKSGYGLEPSRRADAPELCRLWIKDTALFEETYGAGRRMGVGGTILELREFGGDYIISLDGSGPQFKEGRVECYFDPDEMLPLRALRAGDQVSIVGECSGGVKGPILKHSRLEGRL